MIRNQCWSLLTIVLMAMATHAQESGVFAIRGRVVDAAAKPVAGAMVRLFASGFGGFEVDEKTTTDADGQFSVQAPKNWTRMGSTNRQEIALLARKDDRHAIIQFNRGSAPPKIDVELVLAKGGGTKIAILSPDLRPVAGAKVKVVGLTSDTVFVDLPEAQVKQHGPKAKKTSLGYVIGTDTVGLPLDLQMEIGSTDAKGLVTVANLAAASIAGVTVDAPEFGEQSIGYHAFLGEKPPDWPQRIVLKKPGRLLGHLSNLEAAAIVNREVTLNSYGQSESHGVAYSTRVKVVTDREGKFEVPKMVPGEIRYAVKFDPGHPTRPAQIAESPRLKADETLSLKIDLKPAVRVEGRVLDADSKKPIRDIQVRAYLGLNFESATSDAAGKFFFWMAPGEAVFQPDIPEEYLSPISPSDYFDDVKRQQSIGFFKVPEGKSFEAPPLLFHRPVQLQGVVLDDQGRPSPGADISGTSLTADRRTGEYKPRDVAAKTNERGEFKLTGIDPRESMRLRVTAKDVSKTVTIAKPGREIVRIVIAPNERFQISGLVVDSAGKPFADAVLEIWRRDWRPAPDKAEPVKLDLKEAIRADVQGRFKTPALSSDGYYRFTIRAAGAKTTESPWLDATNPETATPQRLVAQRLGGLLSVVRDQAGKPVANAQISLFARETRTDTATNGQGEFRMETPAGTPFCVIVSHPDFRAHGSYYDKNPPHLNQTIVRLSEPDEKLALRPILAKDERETMVKRLIEPFKQRLAKSTNTQEKVQALQSLTGVAPDFVTEFLAKYPLPNAMFNEMLLTQVAMKMASRKPEEAEESIGGMKQGAQKSLAYGMLVDALPEKARAKKLEILAEALVGARAEKSPEFRAVTLGQVAKRLLALGEKDRATTLLREGQKIATGLSTNSFAGSARGWFATDLAMIDLPAALALMKDLKDRNEFNRHHGNTAHRIAGTQPAEAIRVLNLIPPPGPNEFNRRNHYAIRVCYRMGQADLKAAVDLASSITDLPSRAYALGVIAQGIAKTEPKQATELMRRAFALLEEDAARPDPPQLTSPLIPGSVAAALILIAEQTDPTLVRECLWRAVGLQRLQTEDPQQVWRYATGNNALAMVVARYDAKLAESLLPVGKAAMATRESQLAPFLVNPQRTVDAAEKAPKAKDDRELVQLISYLATEEDRLPRLILNSLGIWRIDVEDIDF